MAQTEPVRMWPADKAKIEELADDGRNMAGKVQQVVAMAESWENNNDV